jgi:anti-anti-sigma factor
MNTTIDNGQDEKYLIVMPSYFTSVEGNNFTNQLNELLATDSTNKQIVIDFSETMFIDRNGLNAFCQNLKAAQKHTKKIIIGKLSSQVEIVFSLTGLDRVLQFAA